MSTEEQGTLPGARVLYLSSAMVGHTSRWVKAMTSEGFEVHLVSLDPPRERLDPKVRFYQAPFPPKWGYLANGPWFRRLVTQIRPNLLHAHYATGYGTMAALTGFHPTILSVWGMDVYDFPQHSFLHRSLIRFNLTQADRILSTSHAMAKETSKYTTEAIEVTPFGVDLDQFRPQRVDSLFDGTDIVIGTVKSLEDKYGIEYLIQAFRLLKDRHPDWPLKLLIVGSGSRDSRLKSLSRQLGLAADTVFTGYVPHGEVPRYHNMLTISVSVSISDSESFGVAILEASACEKPVVVSNVGGLPEVVQDGETGIVVQARNAKLTADAIERLILDEELRVRMGKAGRERVRRLYRWETSVQQMTSIYQDVLQKVARKP